MSEISWSTRSIRECLAESFAGEWGAEPLPGNAHVLRATDIDDDGHVIGSGALRRLPIGKLTSRQLEDGDILLEGSGGGPDKPVGRVAFFDAVEHQGPAVCSNFFKTLRPDRRVAEPRFLWRKLMWFYRQPTLLTFQQQTTGIINLKFEEYLNATIEVPADLAEQRVIAQLLDTLDTAIRETEALIDKLKAVKQGLLHDLLTRGIDANGQLRPPQSEAPQLYKESPLGWIPREWEASTVGDCCDVHNNLRLPIASEVREKMQGEYPYYGPTGPLDHIKEYRIDGTYTLIGEDGDHFLKFESKPMTQLVSGRFNVNNHAHLLKGRNCLTEWIDVWFRHRDITLYLTRQGAGRFKLNKAGLLHLLIALPSQDEQQAICTTVAQQEARITAEVECRAKLLCQKAGLMDDLLTGRVRVTPLLESVQQPAAQTGA